MPYEIFSDHGNSSSRADDSFLAMPDWSSRSLRVNSLIAAPHVVWLSIFVILPLCAILFISLLLPSSATTYEPRLTVSNYAQVFQEPYPAVFLFSILIAASTTIICLLIAFPLALAIAFSSERRHFFLLLAICMPFWISTLIRMYSLQEILGRQGVINKVVLGLSEFVSSMIPMLPVLDPLELIYNRIGVLIGLVYAFIPFAILPMYASLVRLDRKLIEASRDLGATFFTTARKIILPLALPGISAAATLIFIPAIGAFYVVDMLGGPEELLIGNLVQLQFHEFNNWPFGAALSVSMLICTLLVWSVTARLRAKIYG